MYFDTHAHYNDEAFSADREAVLEAARASGVELIINAATDRESALESIALAEGHRFVWAAVGWHPHEAKSFDEGSAGEIRSWSAHEKVVAIGEIGLDYYYDYSERSVQREVFSRQLELARELGLPVIVHNRDAHADSMDIVGSFPDVRGVFHSYSGSVEMAKALLDMGWYLGFSGPVTFKNAKKTPEVVAYCPQDRLLIETDCPYLTPVPHRGKRNDSSYLPFIVERIAEIKGLTPAEVAGLSLENGKRLFSKIGK
jgi:TatD DNase family protein